MTPFFKPPYYEASRGLCRRLGCTAYAVSGALTPIALPTLSLQWWNAHRGEDGRWSYEGWERSLAYIEDVLALHGPFDGLIAFSQARGRSGAGVGIVAAQPELGLAASRAWDVC